ncbi:MAG TPA: hypothetical protein VMV19_18200 [Xanthobacteraceae bacterium]|nr:hypothetical protein [Xanthobacteraceae bacterium]
MLLAASKRRKVWFELRVDGTVKLCRIDNARDVLGEFKDAPSAIKFLDAMENLPSAGDGE